VNGTGRAGGGERAWPMLRSIQDPPTAVFCYNDVTAIGLIHAARQAGLSLPGDLAVVGFDDILFARYVHPALTTIAQPIAELGRQAVETVLALLADQDADRPPAADSTIRGRLIVRASSG
jgi:DNA-binding LacI/PurR family transcriptional regulator